jgi:hypothetical protein
MDTTIKARTQLNAKLRELAKTEKNLHHAEKAVAACRSEIQSLELILGESRIDHVAWLFIGDECLTDGPFVDDCESYEEVEKVILAHLNSDESKWIQEEHMRKNAKSVEMGVVMRKTVDGSEPLEDERRYSFRWKPGTKLESL